MKKILLTFAAVAMMASVASAQVLLDMNFEDGTHVLRPWAKATELITVVDSDKANNSKHAVQIKTGAGTAIKGFKENVKYRLTFDKKFVGGKANGLVTLTVYDPEAEGKFRSIIKEELSQVKEYETVSFEFTSPRPFANHHLTFVPSSSGKGGGCYLIDNVKIEVVK